MNKYSKFSFGGFLAVAAVLLSSLSPASAADVDLLISLTGNEDMGGFSQPKGVFFDEKKKRIYVADTANNRLVSFDEEYNPVAEFDANGKLKLPSDIVRDSGGVFYLLAGGKKELTRIDVASKKFEVLTIKNPPRAVNPILPGRLTIDASGKLYMTDKGNGRVLIMDTNGVCTGKITIPGKSVAFSDMRVGADGLVYALSTLDRRVYVFGRDGKMVVSFGDYGEGPGQLLFPVSLAVDKLKRVYVLDQHKGKVLVFQKDGKFLFDFAKKGALPGELFSPAHIYVDSVGKIYIADRGNDRVQVFK